MVRVALYLPLAWSTQKGLFGKGDPPESDYLPDHDSENRLPDNSKVHFLPMIHGSGDEIENIGQCR